MRMIPVPPLAQYDSYSTYTDSPERLSRRTSESSLNSCSADSSSSIQQSHLFSPAPSQPGTWDGFEMELGGCLAPIEAEDLDADLNFLHEIQAGPLRGQTPGVASGLPASKYEASYFQDDQLQHVDETGLEQQPNLGQPQCSMEQANLQRDALCEAVAQELDAESLSVPSNALSHTVGELVAIVPTLDLYRSSCDTYLGARDAVSAHLKEIGRCVKVQGKEWSQTPSKYRSIHCAGRKVDGKPVVCQWTVKIYKVPGSSVWKIKEVEAKHSGHCIM